MLLTRVSKARNIRPLVCALVLLVITAACAIGPALVPSPSVAIYDTLSGPSFAHFLGTDELGRDMLARVLSGGRVSLLVGLAVAVLCLLVGVAVGGIGGYLGGLYDSFFVKVTEVFQVVPAIILALVAAALLGSSVIAIILILSATMWPQIARVARAEVLKIKGLAFVEASRVSGFGNIYLLRSEILPNIFPAVFVTTTMTAGRAILLESGLAFLGLGDANNPSWGALLQSGQEHIEVGWWLTVFPGSAIFLVVLCINLIGDDLNDRLNPTLSKIR